MASTGIQFRSLAARNRLGGQSCGQGVGKRRQAACKPGSVRPRGKRGRDGHSSGTRLAARLARPTRATGQDHPRFHRPEKEVPDRLRRPPLLGLAPGGVCRAAPVAGGAVRSCRTLSPLPGAAGPIAGTRRSRAVCFLWHFPWGRPRRPLAGTVVPVEPGLSSSPGANRSQRPSSRLARRRYARGTPPASMAPGAASRCSAATAAKRSSVPASAAPSTRAGRQRRWNAASSTGKGRSAR